MSDMEGEGGAVEESNERQHDDPAAPRPRSGFLEAEIIEGKREKKTVQRLDLQMGKPREKIRIQSIGQGDKLGDIARVNHAVGKLKTPLLKPLHKILYDRPGTVSSLRKNIRLFNGFPFEVDSEPFNKKKEKVLKLPKVQLRTICQVLDLERGGSQAVLVENIMHFLCSPTNSGRPVILKKKRKRKAVKDSKQEKRSSASKKVAAPESGRSKAIVTDSSSDEEDTPSNKQQVDPSDSEEVEEDKEEEEEQDSDEGVEEETIKLKSKTPSGKRKSTPKKPSRRKEEESEESASEDHDGDVAPKKKKAAVQKRGGTPTAKRADSSSSRKRKRSAVSKSKIQTESSDDDDEPLINLIKKPPTNEELRTTIKDLLKDINLEEVTMKQICQQVYDLYPDFDLTARKDAIKDTVKSLLS